jgi:hypothetical protein
MGIVIFVGLLRYFERKLGLIANPMDVESMREVTVTVCAFSALLSAMISAKQNISSFLIKILIVSLSFSTLVCQNLPDSYVRLSF